MKSNCIVIVSLSNEGIECGQSKSLLLILYATTANEWPTYFRRLLLSKRDNMIAFYDSSIILLHAVRLRSPSVTRSSTVMLDVFTAPILQLWGGGVIRRWLNDVRTSLHQLLRLRRSMPWLQLGLCRMVITLQVSGQGRDIAKILTDIIIV